MPNFKLKFGRFFEDQDESLNTGRYVRIVVADDLELAKRIAKAMVGEEIYANEWLIEPVTVTETNDPPSLSAWNENKTWERTLERMELKVENVEFIFDATGKVGIRIL